MSARLGCGGTTGCPWASMSRAWRELCIGLRRRRDPPSTLQLPPEIAAAVKSKTRHMQDIEADLESYDGRALKAKVSLEVLCDLTHQTLEGQLAQQQLRRLLVAADLTERHCPGAVSRRQQSTQPGKHERPTHLCDFLTALSSFFPFPFAFALVASLLRAAAFAASLSSSCLPGALPSELMLAFFFGALLLVLAMGACDVSGRLELGTHGPASQSANNGRLYEQRSPGVYFHNREP